jgi:hypothetical protein
MDTATLVMAPARVMALVPGPPSGVLFFVAYSFFLYVGSDSKRDRLCLCFYKQIFDSEIVFFP